MIYQETPFHSSVKTVAKAPESSSFRLFYRL